MKIILIRYIFKGTDLTCTALEITGNVVMESQLVPVAQVLQYWMKGMVICMKNDHEDKKAKVSPYDDSIWDRYSMYDNMPFKWDPDLNTEKVFTLVTGNVIKAARCKISKPYEVKHE